jgi:cobalt-zinc-cadmium efflux system outer membrane protein
MRTASVMRRGAATLVIVLAFPAAAWPQAPVQAPMRVSLDDAIQLALNRNQAIRAQRLAIDASRADQITAGLKPNPSVSFGADGFPLLAPREVTRDFLGNVVSYSTSLSYTFERGGKRQNRITVAEDTTDVTTKGVLDAERQLRFQTAQAFINVLLAKSTLALTQANLKSFSDVVDVNRQRVTAGDLAESEFYKISLQKLQFEQDVSSAEVGLVRAKATLRQLLGFDTVPEDFDVNGDLAYEAHSLDLEDLKRQALAARPDLQAAQSGVKLAQDSLTLEHSNRARDVSGDVDYAHTGPDNTFGVGAAFDLPIHDRNQGNIARSEVQVRQATESQLAARFGVITDVITAYAQWQTSQKVVGLYQSGYLNQSQQSLDISRYVYQRGAGSLLDLLDAERTFRDTQLGYLQALADYMTSVQQVNFAVGMQVMR